MKKIRSKTTGGYLIEIIITLLAIVLAILLLCINDKEKSQIVEMQSYHNAELRMIGQSEILIITKLKK